MSDEALESALLALRHRDRSARELERRLVEQGFSEEQRDGVLETLVRTGLVDDARFARARATALATRGAGDERIRFELSSAGIDAATIDEAVAELDPESDRARRIVERRGWGPKTARYLRANGFGPDVAAAVAAPAGDELR